jgi:hypothetical protein
MSKPQTTLENHKFDTSSYVSLQKNPIWINGWNAAIQMMVNHADARGGNSYKVGSFIKIAGIGVELTHKPAVIFFRMMVDNPADKKHIRKQLRGKNLAC